MIFIIHLFITASFAQWIDMPDCPYGMQYVGNECQNAFGQTACPVGYYFDSVQGKCSAKPEANNTNCPEGSIASLDAYGQPTCEASEVTESDRIYGKNDSNKNKPPTSKLRACESAHTRAKRTCQPTATQTPNRLLQLSNQFAVFKNTGNILQACESARDIASLNFATNVKFSVQCLSSAKSCASACDTTHAPAKEREELKNLASECSSYQAASDQGVQQAQFDAATFLKSKACVEVASGDCKGPNAQYITSCLQYCAQNNNKSTAQCKVVNQGCSNTEFYQANYTFCECLKNPVDSSCVQLRFSDLETSTLPSQQRDILDRLKLTTGLVSEDSEFARLTQQGSNQNPSNLPKQQRLGSAIGSNTSNNNPALAQNAEASKTAPDTPDTYTPPSTGTYGTLAGTAYGNYQDPSFNQNSPSPSLGSKETYPLSLQEKKVQKEKLVLSKAFNGKRENYTHGEPVIFYQESDRALASTGESSNWSTKWFYLLAFLILAIFAYKRELL